MSCPRCDGTVAVEATARNRRVRRTAKRPRGAELRHAAAGTEHGERGRIEAGNVDERIRVAVDRGRTPRLRCRTRAGTLRWRPGRERTRGSATSTASRPSRWGDFPRRSGRAGAGSRRTHRSSRSRSWVRSMRGKTRGTSTWTGSKPTSATAWRERAHSGIPPTGVRADLGRRATPHLLTRAATRRLPPEPRRELALVAGTRRIDVAPGLDWRLSAALSGSNSPARRGQREPGRRRRAVRMPALRSRSALVRALSRRRGHLRDESPRTHARRDRPRLRRGGIAARGRFIDGAFGAGSRIPEASFSGPAATRPSASGRSRRGTPGTPESS